MRQRFSTKKTITYSEETGIKKFLNSFRNLFTKKPFARFITRKVSFLLLALFLSLTLVFIIPYFMPINPLDIILSRLAARPGATPLQIENMYQRYNLLFGLDKSIIVQYGLFWKRVFTLNFGVSISFYPNTVMSLVLYALPWTLSLVIPIWIFTFIVGNRLGGWAAFSKNKFIHTLYTTAVCLNASPYYWFGLILVYIFAVKLRWFPSGGAYDPFLIVSLKPRFLLSVLYHYILPFLSLFITSVGNWCTGMRAMTIYERQSDYIFYSKQLGFTENKVRNYAQSNAILPQVTGLPIILSSLIGQTLLVEYIFGWPGLGTLAYQAVTAIDYPMIQAIFLITVGLVLIGNFLIDIIYGFIDPRIRTGYVGG
jgi:peptide/nickel transport system permease protein